MGLADNIADALDIVGGVFDALIDAFQQELFDPFAQAISQGLAGAIWLITHTPAPNPSDGFVFGRPTNGFWGDIYDFYWGEAVPIGLLILFLSYFVTQAAATWGLAGEQRNRGMKKNLLNGLFIIPAAWYLSVLLLQFSQALTQYFAPTPQQLNSIFADLFVGGIFSGGILLAVGGSINLGFVFLAVLINLLRLFAIVMIVGALPIFLGFSYGKVPVLQNLGRGLYTSLPTLAFMALPTAIAMKMSTWMLSGGQLQIQGTPNAVDQLVQPMIFLVPAVFGIVVPVLMYNMKLYQVGGMAAGKAFGATASPVSGASESASERTVGKAEKLGGKAKEVGGSATEIADETRTAVNEMEIEAGAATEDRLDWGEGQEEMAELNEGTYLNKRVGTDERSEDLLPEEDDYFENTDSASQQGDYYGTGSVSPPETDYDTDETISDNYQEEPGTISPTDGFDELGQAAQQDGDPEFKAVSPAGELESGPAEDQDAVVSTNTTVNRSNDMDNPFAELGSEGSRSAERDVDAEIRTGANDESVSVSGANNESVSVSGEGSPENPVDKVVTEDSGTETGDEMNKNDSEDYQMRTFDPSPSGSSEKSETETSTPSEREANRYDLDYQNR